MQGDPQRQAARGPGRSVDNTPSPEHAISPANANDSHYSASMIVRVCHRASERAIACAAHAGCDRFDDLQFELSVAMSCGRCHGCARETFQRHAKGLGATVAQTCCSGHG